MEKIHFPLIPPRDLLRYVNFVEFMRVECNFLLLEASNYHMLPHSQPILQSVRTQVCCMIIAGDVTLATFERNYDCTKYNQQ